MQYSQEHLKTMVYAEFGGQTECIMGNWKIENTREVLENALDSTVTRYGDPSNRCHHRYDILGERYIPCKMMRAVLTHPLFTVKTQYVQSFLKPWNVVIKETNTSFPY